MLVRWPRSICDYENAVKRVFLNWWTLTSLIGSDKLTCRPIYQELSLLQRLLLICLTLAVTVTVTWQLFIGYPCVLPYQFCEVLFWISWELLILCQAISNTIKSVSSELSTRLVEVGFKAVILHWFPAHFWRSNINSSYSHVVTLTLVFGISLYFSNKSVIGFI